MVIHLQICAARAVGVTYRSGTRKLRCPPQEHVNLGQSSSLKQYSDVRAVPSIFTDSVGRGGQHRAVTTRPWQCRVRNSNSKIGSRGSSSICSSAQIHRRTLRKHALGSHVGSIRPARAHQLLGRWSAGRRAVRQHLHALAQPGMQVRARPCRPIQDLLLLLPPWPPLSQLPLRICHRTSCSALAAVTVSHNVPH